MRIDQPYGKRFDEEFANAEPRHKYFISKRSERKGNIMMVPLPSECWKRKVKYPAP